MRSTNELSAVLISFIYAVQLPSDVALDRTYNRDGASPVEQQSCDLMQDIGSRHQHQQQQHRLFLGKAEVVA